jgi:hypothetical protein
MVSKILLWLFVINLGIVFGAGLYEARIEFPQWLIYSEPDGYRWSAAAVRQANTGVRFWVYVTTVPLTLLTLANLVVAWRAQGPIRPWWLGSAVAALVDRVFTFSYFVPTMVKLMSDENIPQAQAVATAVRWGQLNYLRHLIVLVAWLMALKAFSLLAGIEAHTGSFRSRSTPR